MQNLKAEVTITIPKDMVLVNRVDYEDLKRQAEEVKTWSVADFKRELDIPKNVTWIKECLLKPNISEIKSWCTLKEGSGGRTGTVILSTGAKKWYKEFFPKVVDGKDGRPRSAKLVLMADTKRFKAGTQILLNSSHEIIWHKEENGK